MAPTTPSRTGFLECASDGLSRVCASELAAGLFAVSGGHPVKEGSNRSFEKHVPEKLVRLSMSDPLTTRPSVEFLEIDIDKCMTFLDVAETELTTGNFEDARIAIEQAERGEEVLSGFLSSVSPEAASTIAGGLTVLRERLSHIKAKLPGEFFPQ